MAGSSVGVRSRPAAGRTYTIASATAPVAVRRRADDVCPGTADQAMLNTYTALGSVELTDGDYTIAAPITLAKPGHRLEGAGLGEDMGSSGGRGFGTRIEIDASFTGAAAIVVDQANRPAGKSVVRNLTIDGNDVGSVNGIDFRVYQGKLDTIDVLHMGGHGVNVFGYVAGVPSGAVDWNTYDTNMTLLHVASCGGDGLHLGTNATDVHLSTSTFHNNVGSGIHLAGGASAQGANIHCYGNATYGIHFEAAGSRTKFTNTKVEHSYLHGIYFDGTNGGGSSIQFETLGMNCNGKINAAGTGGGGGNIYSHIAFGGTGGSAGPWNGILLGNVTMGNSDIVTNLAKYGIDSLYSGSQSHSWQLSLGAMGSTLASCGVQTARINLGNSAIKAACKVTNVRGFWDWNGTTAPVPTASTGAGTSPPTPVLVGTDTSGYVTFGTGTGPSAIQQVTVTYSIARELSTNGNIQITPANAATAALGLYALASDSSTTAFKVSSSNIPAASQANTVYAFYYHVVN